MIKPKLLFPAAVIWALLQTTPVDLIASGTYRGNLPTPPQRGQKVTVDRSKYNLGQKVFNGKTAPATGMDAAAQKERLQELQGHLPDKVARKKNLVSLAGKLSEEQLQALDYYVHQRYGK